MPLLNFANILKPYPIPIYFEHFFPVYIVVQYRPSQADEETQTWCCDDVMYMKKKGHAWGCCGNKLIDYQAGEDCCTGEVLKKGQRCCHDSR